MSDPGSISAFDIKQFRQFLQEGLQKSGESEGRIFSQISSELSGEPREVHKFVLLYINQNISELETADFATVHEFVQHFSSKTDKEELQALTSKIEELQKNAFPPETPSVAKAPDEEKAKLKKEKAIEASVKVAEKVRSEFEEKLQKIKETLAKVQALPEDQIQNHEAALQEVKGYIQTADWAIAQFTSRVYIERRASDVKDLKAFEKEFTPEGIADGIDRFADLDGISQSLGEVISQINAAIFEEVKTQDSRIQKLIDKEFVRMQEEGVSVGHLSRAEHTFLPFSLTIGPDGTVYRHMHKKANPALEHVTVIPEVGLLGKGGVKAAHRLVDVSGEATHVRSVVHGGGGKEGTVRVSAQNSIDAAKVKAFHDDPNILVGHYFRYEKKNGEIREGFFLPFMQADMGKVDTREFSPQQFANVFLQIASGLDTVHKEGITHFDVNPDNIFINFDPETGEIVAKLSDFDLARKLKPSDPLPKSGSPQYMAPEVAEEGHDSKLAHKADIFSLGATYYRILQDKPIVDGKDASEVVEKMADFKRTNLLADGFPLPENQTPMQKLIWDMLNPDSEARPELSEIKERLQQIEGLPKQISG